MAKPDFSQILARSPKETCPFCPQNVKERTARFVPPLIPEGMLQRGEATVVPNLLPYNKYGAVTVMSYEHMLLIGDFTAGLLFDAFSVTQQYLRRVNQFDPRAEYLSFSWNYMPQGGAGVLHPHLQVCADYIPFNYERKLYRACQRYRQRNGNTFFDDLVRAEREAGERYIGQIGNVVWLNPFAPVGSMMPDVMAVFQRRGSVLELTEDDLRDVCEGLCCVLKYFDDQNQYAFNLGFISAAVGRNDMWTFMRIVPRLTLPPLDTSDWHQMSALHGESWAARTPEEVCSELRAYFPREHGTLATVP